MNPETERKLNKLLDLTIGIIENHHIQIKSDEDMRKAKRTEESFHILFG